MRENNYKNNNKGKNFSGKDGKSTRRDGKDFRRDERPAAPKKQYYKLKIPAKLSAR